jgi:hypothetical protein
MSASPPTLAVHTSSCTYLLDERGVCRSVMASRGVVPGHVRDCIGAQFVACLDMRVEGGLIGDLRVGAMALFVRHHEEGRLVLLRTGKITRVDDQTFFDEQEPPAPASVMNPQSGEQSYGRVQLPPPTTPPPPKFSKVSDSGEERTVTVNVVRLPPPKPPTRRPPPPDDDDTAKVPKI